MADVSFYNTYTVHICPECGQQLGAIDYVALGNHGEGWGYGHYHDPPEDWDKAEDPFFIGLAVQVISVGELFKSLDRWEHADPDYVDNDVRSWLSDDFGMDR